MGKIKFVLALVLFTVCSNFSFGNSFLANHPFYSDPHDSLSFDGSGETKSINTIAEDCTFEIVVIGSVEAMVRTTVPGACEEKGEGVYTWTRKAAKSGDIVKAGEEIVTGTDGYAKLKLSDGSYIIVDKNSKFTPDNLICEQLGGLRIKAGNIFSKIKKLVGGGKFEVVTESTTWAGVRGTEFVVETISGIDIIKVYEGSVEVRPGAVVSKIESKAEKLEKLGKDFEEGKITMEEFTQKMNELASEVQSETENLEIIVEAGYQVKVSKDGTITGPEPIGSDDNRWWEIMP